MRTEDSGSGNRPSNLMFSHVGLSVSNPHDMEGFYSRALGFTKTWTQHQPALLQDGISYRPARHARPLEAEGSKQVFPANHGVAWRIYAHDREDNYLEFIVDTEGYIKQPFLIPLDLDETDEEIRSLTKSMCESSDGYEPYGNWRAYIGKRMVGFKAPALDT